MSEPSPLGPSLAADEVRIFTLDTGDSATVRRVSRVILASLLHVAPDAVETFTTDNGKPLLRNDPELHFSISHSREASMVAVTRVAPVGVDVERLHVAPNMEAILRRFFADDELEPLLAAEDRDLAFIQAWTRTEARVKARGASIWDAATPDPAISVRQIVAPEGYAAAVAVLHTEWHVTQYDASAAGVARNS